MERKNGRNLCQVFTNGDHAGIIQCLIELRKRDVKIDRNTFSTLIQLITIPNSKIVDYSLSIIANCCLHENFRKLFKEAEGMKHVVLLYKNINSDSICGRVCRLFGNLSADASGAAYVHEYGVLGLLLTSLEKHHETSIPTLLMVFRAIRKLLAVKSYRMEVITCDTLKILNGCLESSNTQVLIPAIELLTVLTSNSECKQSSCKWKITKEMLLKLIELIKQEELTVSAIICLSNFIYYHASDVAVHVEGSGLPEAFISYIQAHNKLDGVVLKALSTLCMEGAIRQKVRVSGLLPHLLEHHNAGVTSLQLISLFHLFLYDIPSIAILSKQSSFISMLIENISSNRAVQLLAAVSRLEPPVTDLVLEENLNVIIKTDSCKNILMNITKTDHFLKQILESGKVWRIYQAGCNLEHVASKGYVEGLVVHLLRVGDKTSRENVVLSVPFLVMSRDFRLLYKLLAHHHVMENILQLLNDYPTQERVLASIVRLVDIFRNSFSSNYVSGQARVSHSATDYFQTFVECKDVIMEDLGNEVARPEKPELNTTRLELVTFEFDSGLCATVRKGLLCAFSPVLDAMLNGHFIESTQERVRLSDCSRDAIVKLVEILDNNLDVPELEVGVHLELISLTDRFLIPTLHDLLCAKVPINIHTCVSVCEWCSRTEETEKNLTIRQRTYEFIFNNSEHLLTVMRNEHCRKFLVPQITDYLSNAVKDLL